MGRQLRIGIHNEPSGGTGGGSECGVAVLAEALGRSYSVDIIHHRGERGPVLRGGRGVGAPLHLTGSPPMLGEAALVTVLLGAGMAVQLVLSRGLSLFRRHLWIDEIVTFKLVSDRDVSHALRAIVGGLDTNPPCYHLLLRLLRRLVGSAAEVLLRLFALLCVLLALGGLYVSLRQAFPPPVSLAGVLAV